ncbi:DMT family transporter [Phytopseudomonas seleniipraecipitans]|uniref:Permease of the drug/metabolite transporter (DMT) superfamily n=1 Tax=Phytopseudomonas seleniipraecipitans TaxID=640205 RepID=A0A1G7MDE1_9GAMM|nr:EamA family transporter [Pseudomonas seleniipraecipitans]SDF59685.1 Permease of the drug/metabolite transporter (DMT) superfamily [Pseudomonas seleniipraecipitans]
MTTLTSRAPSRLLQGSDLLLLLVALVWGTSYGVAKEALVFYPVLGFLAVRFCLTFVILLPQLRGEGRQAWAPGIPLGGVMLAIFLCETYGVLHTSASNAAFLISLCVVITPFVEWLMFDRRPDSRLLPAVALSLFGTWLLSGGVDLQFNLGDGLMLMAALLRAVLVCLTGRLTAHTQVPALALTAVQTGVIGIGCLLLGTFTLPGGLPALPEEPAFWIGTLYLVLFATLFAFFVQNYALRRSSPTRVSLLMGSEPLFGALFAVLWLSEELSVQAWIGGLLIVAATLWTSLLRR